MKKGLGCLCPVLQVSLMTLIKLVNEVGPSTHFGALVACCLQLVDDVNIPPTPCLTPPAQRLKSLSDYTGINW